MVAVRHEDFAQKFSVASIVVWFANEIFSGQHRVERRYHRSCPNAVSHRRGLSTSWRRVSSSRTLPGCRSRMSILRMSRSGKRRWSGYRGTRRSLSRSTSQSCRWCRGWSSKTFRGRRTQPARMTEPLVGGLINSAPTALGNRRLTMHSRLAWPVKERRSRNLSGRAAAFATAILTPFSDMSSSWQGTSRALSSSSIQPEYEKGLRSCLRSAMAKALSCQGLVIQINGRSISDVAYPRVKTALRAFSSTLPSA